MTDQHKSDEVVFLRAYHELDDECNQLRAALTELVACRALKIKIGKTPSYERRKALAWVAADRALGLAP